MEDFLFFSDRECKEDKVALSEEITPRVWKGIYGVYLSFVANGYFSKDFPLQCPDGYGVYGTNSTMLEDAAKTLIPSLPDYINENYAPRTINPFEDEVEKNTIDFVAEEYKLSILDFIEFLYAHICDIKNGHYHEFYNHYELSFPATTDNKILFSKEINLIFRRNKLAYRLNEVGNIIRVLPRAIIMGIETRGSTTDTTLNNLILEAETKIQNPKISERKIGLDRLWDAFERFKTILGTEDASKKESANKLLKKIADENDILYSSLEEECKKLTALGNELQIRHYEKGKIEIHNSFHIDYLFFRLYALICLFIKMYK